MWITFYCKYILIRNGLSYNGFPPTFVLIKILTVPPPSGERFLFIFVVQSGLGVF